MDITNESKCRAHISNVSLSGLIFILREMRSNKSNLTTTASVKQKIIQLIYINNSIGLSDKDSLYISEVASDHSGNERVVNHAKLQNYISDRMYQY